MCIHTSSDGGCAYWTKLTVYAHDMSELTFYCTLKLTWYRESARCNAIIPSYSQATMKCFSTDGLPANLLGESLGMVVDENTPSSYSRLVSRGDNSNSGGAVLTGLPLKVMC